MNPSTSALLTETLYSFSLYIFLFLFLVGLILLVLITIVNRVRYEKAKLMTDSELRFYKVLQYATRDKYDVLAQVRLANVVQIPDKYFMWKRFNLLGAKCVDFVLIDKNTGETKLVIELNDRSHERPDRKRRDRFVKQVLKEASVPLLTQKVVGRYDSEKLIKNIGHMVLKYT